MHERFSMVTIRKAKQIISIQAVLLSAFFIAGFNTGNAKAQLVPESQCSKPPCKCDDIETIERFYLQQQQNLDAWEEVLKEFFTSNAPLDPADARNRYSSKTTSDSVLLSKCPSWQGQAEIKLGGLDSSGNPEFDQCFCNTFCDKIVDSVIVHEQRHYYNIITLGVVSLPSSIIAKLIPGDLGRYQQDSLMAQLLTLSEIDAHRTQVSYLEDAIRELKSKYSNDPYADDPQRECTWNNLTSLKTERTRLTQPLPETFTDRVRLLLARISHGNEG